MRYCILGIIVDCQTHRSQYQNKKIALEKLRLKLFKIQLEEKTSSVKKVRKSQVCIYFIFIIFYKEYISY